MNEMVESSISCVNWVGELDKPEGKALRPMMDIT